MRTRAAGHATDLKALVNGAGDFWNEHQLTDADRSVTTSDESYTYGSEKHCHGGICVLG
jgi:hypothetical protein